MDTTGLLKRIREGKVRPARNYTAEVDADLNAAAIAGALVAMNASQDIIGQGEMDAYAILTDSPAGRRISG